MENAECIVQNPIAFVLRLSRVMGLAPLHIEAVWNGFKIRVSSKWALYSYFLITFLNVTNVVGLAEDFRRKAMKTQTFSTFILYIPDVTGAMLITGLGVYGGARRMQDLIFNLILFNKIKKNLKIGKENNSDKLKYRNKMRIVIGLAYLGLNFFFFLVEFYINLILFPNEKFIVSTYGMFFIEYLIIVVLQMQMTFMQLEVDFILEMISARMDEMLCLDTLEDVLNNNFENFAHAYVSACRVTSRMSSADGGIVVLIFANFIISIVTTGFYADLIFFKTPSNFTFVQVSWCLLYAIKIVMFVDTFNRINVQVKKIQVCTSKIMVKTSEIGKRCSNSVDVMYNQLLLNEPHFKPMGMFTLNRALLVTILGAVATYLLFMIQFKDPNNII